MYNYKEKTFIFKNQMVEYIADYYSGIGEALSDAEYDELAAVYKSAEEVQKENLEKMLIAECRDFDIYRMANGDWFIRRVA